MNIQIPTMSSAANTMESMTVSSTSKARKATKGTNVVEGKTKVKSKKEPNDSDSKERFRFLPEEDLCITKIYINKTANSIKGTDMKATVFWRNIFDTFCIKWKEWGYQALHGNKSAEERNRTSASIELRWRKTINHDLHLYKAALSSAKRKYTTGNIDITQQALEIFKTKHGREFKHLDCWDVAKSTPKFADNVERGNDGDENKDDEEESIGLEESSFEPEVFDLSFETTGSAESSTDNKADPDVDADGPDVDAGGGKSQTNNVHKPPLIHKPSFDPTRNTEMPPGCSKAKKLEQDKKIQEKEKKNKKENLFLKCPVLPINSS